MVVSALICFVEAMLWWNIRWNFDVLRVEQSRLLNLSPVIPYVSVIVLVLTRKVQKLGLSLATGAGLVATIFALSFIVHDAFFGHNEYGLPWWIVLGLDFFGGGLVYLPHGFMAWCAVKAWRDIETNPRGLGEFIGLSCLGSLFSPACYWPILQEFWPIWKQLWWTIV